MARIEGSSMDVLCILNAPQTACVMALAAAVTWSPHLLALQTPTFPYTPPGSVICEMRPTPLTVFASPIVDDPCYAVRKIENTSADKRRGLTIVILTNEEAMNEHVLVYRRADRALLQWIVLQADEVTFYGCPQVQLMDLNFDGYPDLEITLDEGMHDGTYERWLYVPEQRRFVFHPELSELGRLNVEEDQSLIHYATLDAYHCYWSRYRFIDGNLTEVERGRHARKAGMCQDEIETLRDGRYWDRRVDVYEE